jgi:NAD(P)-dependent dehydrogenase (short-subunit alcohol dehydrogenase family)
MSRTLENKVALVVGGSSGLGKAGALALAAAGAKVVVAARRVEESLAVVEEIKAAGGTAAFVKADATIAAEAEAMVATTVELFGRVDCAFNNVGIGGDFVLLHELDEAYFDRLMNTNVKGIWLPMKYEIIQMLRQGSGSIVNMSSVLGLVGVSTTTIYSATKHAVLGMTKSAALAYATNGIRVNAVCPTVIADTPIVSAALQNHPELMNPFIEEIPMKRLGTSAEVAAAVVWLCSDASSLMTGHALVLDGGHLAK